MYILRNEELLLFIKLFYCLGFKKFSLFIIFYELYFDYCFLFSVL